MTKEKGVKNVGLVDDGAFIQAQNCLKDAEDFCLMADNHKGYGMPVGGVAVYKDKICPAGVGFDIACGNKAVLTNLKYDDIKGRLPQIADLIKNELSFGIGRKNKEKVEHPLFDSELWDLDLYKNDQSIKATAINQLGTIGSGNHYVDIFKDELDRIWVGVHFGSRGLGHKTASHFMKVAGDNLNIMDETPHLLDVNSKEGSDYIKAMTLCGMYAYAGRDWVCSKVTKLLCAIELEEVHNHHNFAWKEIHKGNEYWVIRKGATPSFPYQKGFVGGSMGDNAVIIEGKDTELNEELYYSAMHGAGRVMSRTQALGKTKRQKVWQCGNRNCEGFTPYYDLKPNEEKPRCVNCGSKMNKWIKLIPIKEGSVNFEAVKEDLKAKGIELRGAGADEAPQVYKRLEDVLKMHEGAIKVLHTLTPLIVCMAGSDEFDPYKD